MWELNEKFYGQERNKAQDDFIADITFFNGVCYSCKTCHSRSFDCSNLTTITSTFRSECRNLLLDCHWNGRPFDCCQGFIGLSTEFGTCYTINSLHTGHRMELISNRIVGAGRLELFVQEDVELYLHSSQDVPSKSINRNLHETILWGTRKEIFYNVLEIVNDENVEIESPYEQRRCRFPWETLTDDMHLYSYSTCMALCNFNIQMKVCNCVHHLMPMTEKQSVLSGIVKNIANSVFYSFLFKIPQGFATTRG